jgi:TolA-binding protein
MQKNVFRSLGVLLIGITLTSCAPDSAGNSFLLAERYWTRAEYDKAVLEFLKAARKDAKGKLGEEALLRAAKTQSLFLKQHKEAVSTLQELLKRTRDAEMLWETQLELGDLYYSRLENWEEAEKQYRQMAEARPEAREAPLIFWRLGSVSLKLYKFEDASRWLRKVINEFPKTDEALEASYALAEASLQKWNREVSSKGLNPEIKQGFRDTIVSFESFREKYPNHPKAQDALFGMANAYEELEDWEKAEGCYNALKETYPLKDVLELRVKKLQARKKLRNL